MSNATELRLDSRSHSFHATATGQPRRSAFAAIWPALLAIGLLLGLAVSPAAALSRSASTVSPVALGPGTVFATIEEAAFDALRFASLEKAPRYRGRMRAGTIFRVGDGFSYRKPAHSRGTVWSSVAPVVRFKYAEADVASYVVHPRSGRASIDRANEGLRSALSRRIENSDPSGRSLFLLTPKLRVIRYAPGEKAEVLSGLENRTVAVVLP